MNAQEADERQSAEMRQCQHEGDQNGKHSSPPKAGVKTQHPFLPRCIPTQAGFKIQTLSPGEGTEVARLLHHAWGIENQALGKMDNFRELLKDMKRVNGLNLEPGRSGRPYERPKMTPVPIQDLKDDHQRLKQGWDRGANKTRHSSVRARDNGLDKGAK